MVSEAGPILADVLRAVAASTVPRGGGSPDVCHPYVAGERACGDMGAAGAHVSNTTGPYNLRASEPWRSYSGMLYSGGLEEYAEAVVFAHFIKHGAVPPSTHPDLARCDRDEYLGGVLDFTGELNRFCVAKATVRDVTAVNKCREIVDSLMGIFLKFDFRNGALRKKYDSLKYTLKKVENTLYEMSLTSAAAKRSREDAGLDDDVPRKGGEVGEDE